MPCDPTALFSLLNVLQFLPLMFCFELYTLITFLLKKYSGMKTSASVVKVHASNPIFSPMTLYSPKLPFTTQLSIDPTDTPETFLLSFKKYLTIVFMPVRSY